MADPKNIYTVPEEELEAMVAAALGRAGDAGEMGLSRAIVERMIQRFYDAMGKGDIRFSPTFRGTINLVSGGFEYEIKGHDDGVVEFRMVDKPPEYRSALLLRPHAANKVTVHAEMASSEEGLLLQRNSTAVLQGEYIGEGKVRLTGEDRIVTPLEGPYPTIWLQRDCSPGSWPKKGNHVDVRMVLDRGYDACRDREVPYKDVFDG